MAVNPEESISGVVASVRSGSRRAVEVIEAALERCEAAQPNLNAFTYIDLEGARRSAVAIDSRIAAGESVGPLAGVPIAVKDLFDHAGRPSTFGSSGAPAMPATTATCIERLESAGAVIVARTGLHEFAFGFSSENEWHGPVENPWDEGISPGGSSGGSASAVSAGLVSAALGTDTGGSVRVPAALCGIVGLKVTHGRVSLRGVFPLAPMLDTVGPMARTVADTAAVYAAIAGDDPLDPWSVPREVESVGSPTNLRHLTIGVPLPWARTPVTPDQAQGFTRFLDGVSDAGASVVEVPAEGLGPSPRSTHGLYFEVASVHGNTYRADPTRFGAEVAERLAATLDATPEDFVAALEWRRATRSIAERALIGVDVLATPTVATLRKEIGQPEVTVGTQRMPYGAALSMFTTPVNHIGLPAIALPLPGASNPPPSVQLIGPSWSESRLLEIGLALEKAGISVVQKPPRWRPA